MYTVSFFTRGQIHAAIHRRTKKKDIYVISTAKRPVPLEHNLYAGRALHMIVDANGKFNTEKCVPLMVTR